MKDVFLCHAGADKAWVRELGARLEAEKIGNRNIEVFLDEWDVGHGENIVEVVDRGLKEAKLCAVVLSPAMVKKDWPKAEWTARFMSDPSGRGRQLLPILLHEKDPDSGEPIDIPMLLRPLRRFDFTKESNFDSEFADLVRHINGERPRRGGWRASNGPQTARLAGAEAPDAVQELLVANLLSAESLPPYIWSDVATTQRNVDVWKSMVGSRMSPFLLSDGRLYSFIDPASDVNPFRQFLKGTFAKREEVSAWVRDPIRAPQLMRLFNDSLQEHAYHLRIRNLKDNRKQYYCPVFDGKARQFKWAGGGRVRTIAKVAPRPDNSKIGIHYSARMRFHILGSRVFLLVEPGWMFTSDGVTPLEGKQVTVLSTKFGGKERNAAVLRNVLMWAMLLADGNQRIRISLGDATLVINPVPVLSSSTAGIDGDAINLDRIFGEGVAGEVTGTDAEDEEIEDVLTMAVSGALGSEEDSSLFDEEGE